MATQRTFKTAGLEYDRALRHKVEHMDSDTSLTEPQAQILEKYNDTINEVNDQLEQLSDERLLLQTEYDFLMRLQHEQSDSKIEKNRLRRQISLLKDQLDELDANINELELDKKYYYAILAYIKMIN